MSIRNEQRERAIGRLAEHLLATGLAQTSLRQLAGAAGVSDRMLLYYFADKAEVLAAAMTRIAAELAGHLAVAMPDGERLPARELVLRAAALTTRPQLRPFMRLWVEVVAAAARDEAPFTAIAAQISQGFMDWVENRLAMVQGPDRAATAAAIIAIIDGVALIDICSGRAAASGSVAALGRLLAAG